MKEFAILETIENEINECGGSDLELDMKKTLMAKIFDQLQSQIQTRDAPLSHEEIGGWIKQKAPQYLQEMSSMAGGAVQGFASGFKEEGPFAQPEEKVFSDKPETINEIFNLVMKKKAK